MRALPLLPVNKAFILVLVIIGTSCQNSQQAPPLEAQVKAAVTRLSKLDTSLIEVAVVNHHALAELEGVYTPPSTLMLYSDPKVNTPILQHNIRAGLDLPYKVLFYSEPDTLNLSMAISSGQFISQRHNVPLETLNSYQAGLEQLVQAFPKQQLSAEPPHVSPNFGIKEVTSHYPFRRTVTRVKKAVLDYGNTQWFGSLDYTKQANSIGMPSPKAVLLLFGDPKQSGLAMANTPRIGLDALCQKLLIYEDSLGATKLLYNDIEAFSKLYYGTSTKQHKRINARLDSTYIRAINPGVPAQ